MTKQFHKPTVQFPLTPFIFAYIEVAYNKVQTYDDFVNFIHACFSESEATSNEVRSKAYQSLGQALYSCEVGESYESKSIEILIENL